MNLSLVRAESLSKQHVCRLWKKKIEENIFSLTKVKIRMLFNLNLSFLICDLCFIII
jgi:hypothetical protein